MRLSRSQSGNALVIGLVAVAVLAVVIWFVFFSSSPLSDPPGDEGSTASSDAVYPDLKQNIPELPDPAANASAEALSSKSTVSDGKPGDEARALIARFRKAVHRPDMHDIHVRGVRFLNEGKPVDAYLLWFFAAREGHSPSALVLGEMYDPEYFTGANEVMESADASQAYRWYLRASEAGDPVADERLSALLSTVEQAAADGDDDARRLLLRWK